MSETTQAITTLATEILPTIIPIIVILTISTLILNYFGKDTQETILETHNTDTLINEIHHPYTYQKEEEPEIEQTINEWECQNCLALNPPTTYKCHNCSAPKRKPKT